MPIRQFCHPPTKNRRRTRLLRHHRRRRRRRHRENIRWFISSVKRTGPSAAQPQ